MILTGLIHHFVAYSLSIAQARQPSVITASTPMMKAVCPSVARLSFAERPSARCLRPSAFSI